MLKFQPKTRDGKDAASFDFPGNVFLDFVLVIYYVYLGLGNALTWSVAERRHQWLISLLSYVSLYLLKK